jgi:hypothetical protein
VFKYPINFLFLFDEMMMKVNGVYSIDPKRFPLKRR